MASAAAGSSSNLTTLDQLRDLADMFTFEPFPKKAQEGLVNQSIRTLLPTLRAFLLIKRGLLQDRSLAMAAADELIQEGGGEDLRSVSGIGRCN
jgi:multidrug resistance protein MdtO